MAQVFDERQHPRHGNGQFASQPGPGVSSSQVDRLRSQADLGPRCMPHGVDLSVEECWDCRAEMDAEFARNRTGDPEMDRLYRELQQVGVTEGITCAACGHTESSPEAMAAHGDAAHPEIEPF